MTLATLLAYACALCAVFTLAAMFCAIISLCLYGADEMCRPAGREEFDRACWTEVDD